MKRVLGIDLGTNSLGWGIIENSKILDCGVLIFEQGIPLVKGRESDKSPAAERTQFRAARRLKYRRRLRKYHTLKILLENGMCPLSLQELQDWIRRGVFPIENQEFISWLNSSAESNPYYFRAKAAAGRVKPFELGRAFYHIAIRRGFKSSKKDQSLINDKETGELKSKIKELEEKLILSGQTLGEYLYECVKQNTKIRGEIKCGRVEHYIPEFEKICRVQDICGELKRKLFDALFMQRPLRSQRFLVGKCSLEKKFSRTLAAHPLFEKYRMLSFINTIKVQVDDGALRFLTPEERLTAVSAFMVKAACIKFEKISKVLKKVHFKNHNVVFNYREDQTVASSSLIYQLQNIFGCNDIFKWTQEYRDSKGRSKTMDYQAVFDGLKFFKIDFDGDDSSFKRFVVERLGLDEEKTSQFMNLSINDSYAKYSLFAIRKIIPFLEMGFIEPYAVYLAKLPNILGDKFFSLHKDSILADFQQCVDDYTWEKNNITFRDKCRVLSLSERFKDLLEDKYKCPASKTALLYEFKEKSNYSDHIKDGILPRVELGMMFNPMVHRSLTVLRRLVNHLRKSGKIDADTEIHIELARDVNDKNTRLAIGDIQRKNESLRSQAVAEFAEYKIVPTEDQILRWRLWNEQKRICIYTGRRILDSEIFTNQFSSLDIEHTIPRSLGGENNLENLTLCDSTYNRDVKKGKLPSECPNYDNSQDCEFTICDGLTASGFYDQLEEAEKNYSAISSKLKSVPASSPARPALRQKQIVAFHIRKYWREKLLAFEIGRTELESGFSRRQLAATGVMSRHALQFLKSAYHNVYANNGRVTAFTRKTWGLQDQYGKKERVDHTHHAIDALVIAALDREGLSRIANAYHECEFAGNERDVIKISYPWQTFPEDVYSAVENIIVKKLVSHNETKQTKHKSVYLATPFVSQDGTVIKRVLGQGDTVRGQLHDQTYYGCILDRDNNKRFVLRTTLTPDKFSSPESLDKIVDKGVREAVIAQIKSRMYEGAGFAEALSAGVYMKTKSGAFDGPVIKKVRVFRDDCSPLVIKKQTYITRHEHKNNYYAETSKGGNFMIALYRSPGIPATEKRYVYELISLWNWAKEHKQEDYVPVQKRCDKGVFVGTISPGTTVLFYKDSPDELKKINRAQLGNRVYVITELSKDGRMCLRWHREARSKKDAMQFMSQQFGMQQSSEIEWCKSIPLLRISQGTYQNHTLFSGIDFDISVDGEITFRE